MACKIHFLVIDLPHSDAMFVKAYPRENSEAFCDGHVAAFEFFGGVPQSTHVQYLLRLSELELIERHRRMIERRIKAAKFRAVKSLDSFDFKAMPSLNKVLVMELARSEYIDRQENIIALGRKITTNGAPAKPISPWALVWLRARRG